MLGTTARSTLVAVMAILLVALVGLVAACSNEDTSTTSVTSSSLSASPSTDGTTTATSEQRVVVGGEDADVYAAQITELQKSLQANPDDLETLQQLAVAQYNTSAYEEAAATYEKMLALEDNAFTRNNYANVLRDWGKTADAKANYEKSISIDQTLITPYLNLASVLVREGNTREAITVLESGLDSVIPADKERIEAFLAKLQGSE